VSILSKFGLTGLQRWFMSDTVIPVAIVDSEITLSAATATPLVNAPASGGEIAVPAANTRLATTGALPAGPYTMVFWIGANENNAIRVRRRNAADTADIWAFRHVSANAGFQQFALRLFLAVNEFVVVENVLVGGAGSIYQAAIFISAG
jgi:hypothetical protein